MSQYVADGNLVQTGYEQITVAAVAIGFTEATFKTSELAYVRVDGDIRFQFNATDAAVGDPTAALGMPWGAGDGVLVVPMESLETFRMISQGGSVTADVQYINR